MSLAGWAPIPRLSTTAIEYIYPPFVDNASNHATTRPEQLPECGHTVSHHAKECPGCKWEVELCRMCGGLLGKGDKHQGQLFHRACYVKSFNSPEEWDCPECGGTIRREVHEAFQYYIDQTPFPSCPHCGVVNPGFGLFEGQANPQLCARCNLPIMKRHRSGQRFDNDGDAQSEWYHAYCRPPEDWEAFSDPNAVPEKSTGCLSTVLVFMAVVAGLMVA